MGEAPDNKATTQPVVVMGARPNQRGLNTPVPTQAMEVTPDGSVKVAITKLPLTTELPTIPLSIATLPSVTIGSVPNLTIAALPNLTIASVPVVPAPRHIFALSNDNLVALLSGAGTFNIAVSYVNILLGVQTSDNVVVAATGASDVTLLAAIATGTTFITSIMFSNNTGGVINFSLKIGAALVLTLDVVPDKKTVMITPAGISTF